VRAVTLEIMEDTLEAWARELAAHARRHAADLRRAGLNAEKWEKLAEVLEAWLKENGS